MTERYELINREEGHYPTSSMCRWSSVSKSGYYSWRDRPQSQTAIRREELAMMIKDVFERSDGTYGYRRIQVSLERRGVRADGSTIRSIMRDLGLQAAGPRAKVRTTVPAQDLDARPDLLRRDFTADEPGRKWCGDITYVRTWTGFIYLATVLDCCTKKVVGYAMADHMHTSLVCQAIDMAVRRCPVEEGVTVFHSDRGSQYTSQRFLDHLKGYGIRPSVGRTGVCWDNAWAESFNATLKNESVPDGIPNEGQGDERYCLVDRAEIQSYSSSLSPRVSHSRRGRKRVPGPEEGSLKHKTSTVRKTPSSPGIGSRKNAQRMVLRQVHWVSFT